MTINFILFFSVFFPVVLGINTVDYLILQLQLAFFGGGGVAKDILVIQDERQKGILTVEPLQLL